MNFKKKTIKLLLVLSLSLSSALVFLPNNADAKCRQTNLGKQCDNNIVSQKRVKTYYTKAQVKKLVARYDSLGTNKSLIIAYAIGLVHPSAGLSTLMYQVGANNMIKEFKKAKSKKTGLEISYTYTIYTGSNAMTKVSGTKYKYR
ncbi:hypothetical protein P9B42_11975 [Bacillus safensis]|uniref:hypothetical protein n=1 Tax=Bacillus TaxID=1386 RepID=UPI002DBE9FA2|nr:hypothetical protein [Bacillus safensis]MEC0923930.1 hypothetical protein [Bacillus safensis]MEC0996918.1 hypothetical protein [Bacillus safensis]MEC0999397.1 hypothetical protein [Bacillus safensis]